MSQPASRAYVIAFALIGAVALSIITSFVLAHRLGVVEHQVTTIEHRKTVVTATPCVRSADRACQAFIDALLSDATRAELRTLLGAEAIRIPRRGLPRLIGQLQRLLHPRHRRHHRRRTLPGPPSPFSPIPPTPRPPPPEGVMPAPKPKPHPGNGLPGRPRHQPRSPRR